ncbi:MAG TPA: type 1 glutamine amidotransferase [Acidiferrobacterales bacterium]|nr:type 1 glutamine amidotransferase [Acidiferrobacterales bacterium]
MKPIAIFRHSASEGPGYFATFLDRHRLPWTLVNVDDGAPIPPDPRQFAGLCFMGGPMSVNDDLPWILESLRLIRDAVAADVPVIGHCLGGQLIAKALGGSVTRNAVKEIGWGTVEVADSATAREWLGETRAFESFHWHGETFSIPEGATPLLSSRHCRNQAFAFGNHLALQCHLEMTEKMIASWCQCGAAEIAACASPAVQAQREMLTNLAPRLDALRRVADCVYSRWNRGLR